MGTAGAGTHGAPARTSARTACALPPAVHRPRCLDSTGNTTQRRPAFAEIHPLQSRGSGWNLLPDGPYDPAAASCGPSHLRKSIISPHGESTATSCILTLETRLLTTHGDAPPALAWAWPDDDGPSSAPIACERAISTASTVWRISSDTHLRTLSTMPRYNHWTLSHRFLGEWI